MAIDEKVWDQLELALQAVYYHLRKSERVRMLDAAEEFIRRAKEIEEKRK